MDGKTFRKNVERLTEINKLRMVASRWLYSENILAIHGAMNVKCNQQLLHKITDIYLDDGFDS